MTRGLSDHLVVETSLSQARATGIVDDTTPLPGLDRLAIAVVDDGADVPVVHLITADEQARRCPERGTWARRSKRWRTNVAAGSDRRWSAASTAVARAPMVLPS
jgi:hypothetical protein